MNPRAIKRRRSKYAYPSVGLKNAIGNPAHLSFRATAEMDAFHSRSFHSVVSRRMASGYLSTVYWGHYSGKAGRVTAARALSKVKMAKAHPDFVRSRSTLRKALANIKRNKIAEAILCMADGPLPQVGFAFASKICAFMAPEKCGVIDSVIASQRPNHDFELDGAGYVRSDSKNAMRYEKYCMDLQRRALVLNRLGVRFRWRDQIGRAWAWRAVDVERAMY